MCIRDSSGVVSAHDHDGPGRDIDKVNGSITASAGEAYGDLSTVNGGIDLESGARAGDCLLYTSRCV